MGSRTGYSDDRATAGDGPPPKGIVRDYAETILICVIFVVFTLYYSNLDPGERIHKEIGWDAKCGPQDTPRHEGLDTSVTETFARSRFAQPSLRRMSVAQRGPGRQTESRRQDAPARHTLLTLKAQLDSKLTILGIVERPERRRGDVGLDVGRQPRI